MLSPLPVSVSLRTALQKSKVAFALWKSNSHIDDALAGKTDLDMLVAIRDRTAFEGAMLELKALKVRSQPWASYPDVEDWLVFDNAAAEFLHLHVHYALVTGLKRVKHLRLPWADTVLANLRIHAPSGWPIPAAEMELVILLVRIWAKMPPWRRVFAPKLPPHIGAEMRWLASDAKADLLAERLAGLGLKADIALPLGDDAAIIALARNLYGQVRQHYRVSWDAALLKAAKLNLQYALTRLWQRHIGPTRYRKTLVTDGAMIAFIGSDGSGKSTVSQSLERWLRQKLDVHLLYMGSGDGRAGWLNSVRRQFSTRLGKKTGSGRPKSASTLPQPASVAEKTYRLFNLLLLRRKLKLLRLGRKLASSGSIILLDRYPQSQFEAISDGPKLQNGRSFAWAAASERKLLAEAARLGPDLVIKLNIDPQTAIRRKPDHNLETIRRKCAITDALEFSGSKVCVIDAAQDLEDVVSMARKLIWAHLAKTNLA